MRARREAKEAAASVAAVEKQSEKQYLDAVLREYKPRKGGTAKWKKGSKVLVPHTDQARRQAGWGVLLWGQAWQPTICRTQAPHAER